MHVVQEVTLNKEVNYFAQETNDFYGQPYAVFVFPSLQIKGFIAGWRNLVKIHSLASSGNILESRNITKTQSPSADKHLVSVNDKDVCLFRIKLQGA